MMFHIKNRCVDISGLYENDDLVIVGSSPSLEKIPSKILNSIKINTLALNNSAKYFNPDILVIADKPSHYYLSIILSPKILKFVPYQYQLERVYQDYTWLDVPNTIFYFLIEDYNPEDILDSKDIFWWKNVFMIALQISLKLGFKRIYFCGCDFRVRRKSYFDNEIKLSKEKMKYNKQTYDLAFEQFIDVLPRLLDSGIELISCSLDSRLNNRLRYVDIEKVYSEVNNIFDSFDKNSNLKHSLDEIGGENE